METGSGMVTVSVPCEGMGVGDMGMVREWDRESIPVRSSSFHVVE